MDYVYAMRACQQIGAPYIAMLEDDIVAMDGWFHRLTSGLQSLEQTHQAERGIQPADFLYLRMFWTETFLGWNAEERPVYLRWSLILALSLYLSLTALQLQLKKQVRWLQPQILALYIFIFLPSLIGLTFASGRLTLFPLRRGVVAMDRFGCCSQGLVFPSGNVDTVIHWPEGKSVGFVDQLIEELADTQQLHRYALVPSVLQHIGSISSKEETPTVTKWI